LWEIPDYVAELASGQDAEPDTRRKLVTVYEWRDHERLPVAEYVTWVDPSAVVPAGPVRGQSSAPRVGGSHEPPVPLSLDAADLLAPARAGSVGVRTRGGWSNAGGDPDQVGSLSVATVLDSWVRDWATYFPADPLPGAEVGDLVAWLVRRVEEMCGQHPAIDEFAREIRDVHSTLRRVSGWAPRGSQRPEESCPDCHVAAVWREDIATDHECMHCGRMFTAEEFAAAHGKTVPWAA
jgi:hypothetical protein